MLLDEPTNHLDMRSVNVLIRVLNKYEGTFVCVSHDRYFLSQIANKIWYIEDKKLKEYPGTYEEYHVWLEEKKDAKNLELRKLVKQQSLQKDDEKKAIEIAEVQNNPRQNSQDRKKQQNKLSNAVKQFESKIEKLKKDKENLLTEMSRPEIVSDHEKMKAFNHLFQRVEKDLTEIIAQFEEAYLQLLELEE